MEYRLGLVEHGKHLWTREKARQIRPEIEARLDRAREGDTLVIDMNGVEAFDFSFANELFGKTVLSLNSGDYRGRFVVVENLTEYTRENLEKSLQGLGLVMIERRGTELVLMGKTNPTDRATFDAIVRAKEPMTAAALSEQLGVAVTAANERLTKLTNLSLLRRGRSVSPAGREQYTYSVLA